jgi:hypothetical protein
LRVISSNSLRRSGGNVTPTRVIFVMEVTWDIVEGLT